MLYSPRNLEQLISFLEIKDEKTYFIAGGTDLIIKLKNNKIFDYSLIDLTKVESLKKFNFTDEKIYIGSMITMTELLENEIIKKEFKSLYQAAYHLGSEQIRNLATVGGNIANASQSADVVLALYSLGAEIKVLNSNSEEKVVSIDEIVIGKEKTSLKNDEVITEIILKRNKNRIESFNKVGARKAVTISKISCALNLEEIEGKIKNASIYFGAVGIVPNRAKVLENYFIGKTLEEINVEDIKDLSTKEIDLAIPTRSSRNYKRIAVRGLMEDLIKDLRNEK